MPVTKVCPRCGEEYDDAVAFCAKDGTRLVTRGGQAELIGTIIADRYRIVSRIGEGGMGQVYLAEHVRMKRKSAIKIMRHALVGDVEALQRFTREAENASQIAHPNVAAIFDFGETSDGIVYLAMEYVDGTSLAATLTHDLALHPDVAADILGQAADALQAAHDLGILHRDLKPDNIMLGRRADGTFMVKLVDFGIARTMDGSDQKVTRTGFAIGTPAFMSPEQLAGDVLDARSDQYALALVAFVALTGKDAFPAESSKESLIARLTSRPRTLQEAKEDVQWPAPLQAVFDTALSPEPNERYESVSEFARALATAISAMTPSQTAELYRRALDIRVAHAAMRTPHSDLQAMRTPNSPLATVTPPGPRETVERRGEPRAETADERRATPRAAPAMPYSAAPASGAYVAIPDEPLPPARAATAAAASGSGALPVFTAHISLDEPIADAAARTTEPGRTIGRGRVVAAVAGMLVVAAGAWLALRPGATPAVATGSAATDTMAATAGPPIVDSATRVAVAPGMPDSVPGAVPPVLTPAQADSAQRKATRDSLRAVQRAQADSARKRAALLARFPEAPVRAAIAAAIDSRNYSVRGDDIRATIMTPPVTVWRAERASAWKARNPRPDVGIAYDVVDPIEVWTGWKRATSARRPVYVLEVAPEKAPWPNYDPAKLFDLRRGDIQSVQLLRDGAPVVMGEADRVPALVNEDAHVRANRPNPRMFVATLAPDAFAPRADGAMPKIELLVRDGTRRDPVRLTLPERAVRRLYDEFAPWRELASIPLQ